MMLLPLGSCPLHEFALVGSGNRAAAGPQLDLSLPPQMAQAAYDSTSNHRPVRRVLPSDFRPEFSPYDGRLPIAEGREDPIHPPDARPLQHHPDSSFRHVENLANHYVGVSLGQSSQHHCWRFERVLVIESQPTVRLGSSCFRWGHGCTVPDSQQRSNCFCPRSVVSKWIEIPLGHLRRNVTHSRTDDRLRNTCSDRVPSKALRCRRTDAPMLPVQNLLLCPLVIAAGPA